MINTFKKSLLLLATCLMVGNLWAETAIFEGDNLNVSGGAKTVGSIQLSVPASNGMTWSSNSLYASGSNKFFHLDATGGASISKVLITMNTTSNRYQASNITGCTSCTKDGSVYTCEFSTPQSSIDFKNNGGGVGITKLEVTYSTSGGGDTPGGDTPGGDTPGGDTPSGDTYAFWRFSGSNAPTAGSSESGTKMTVEFLTSDDSKSFSTESVAYNSAVTTDDMKSQGSKGLKMGANALYLKVTVEGGFKKDDQVSICGYNSWKVSSSAEHSGDIAASVATGTSKTDYNIGSFTLNADASVLYMMRAEASGTCISAIKVVRSGGSTPPTPVAVESVTLDKTTLTIEAGKTAQLTATVSPDNAANKNISWASDDNTVATVDENGLVSAIAAGTANITVTTEDQGKTATCVVMVTPPATPIEVESIRIKSATTIAIGSSETLSVTYTPENANTGKAITWTSNNESVATVDAAGKVTGIAAGTATITATTEKGKTATCTVTVEAISVSGVSLNKTSLTLKEGDSETLTATIAPSNATDKSLSWSSDNTAVASVANGVVTAVAAGTATITVKTNDGGFTASCTLNVTAKPAIITDLTLHAPEKYEAKDIAGGYNTPLTVMSGHEYEVYYATRDGDSKFCVATTNADKTQGITSRGSGDYDCAANDGWFKLSGTGWSSTSDAMGDEFGTMARRLDMDNTCEFSMYISGFDQFAIVARDKKKDTSSGQTKPEDNRYLEVYIDKELQPQQFNTNPSIRRYDLPSGEHLIRIKHIGSEKSAMYAFSLRIAQEPRTKWLKGNDSTQTVNARGTIKPVTYFTKYNAKGETKLIWNGPEATGIILATTAQGKLGDTLALTGTANCPAGEYHYAVVAYYNGAETSRAEGKFKVVNSIQAVTDTVIDAYQNEEIDEIRCKYFVYDEATDLHFNWFTQSGAPGITTAAKNGTFIISGTPTEVGTYYYILAVTEGDTITGRINVKPLDLGNNPVLYLYKNNFAYDHDGIYQYLKKSGRNLIERKTKSDLRTPDQYNKYKWILISEDVDANNPEVFKIIHGGTNIPVLNMKAFSYAHPIDSLTSEWGGIWGEADNGSLSENGKSITVLRDDHPIFKNLNKKKGDKIQVLDSIDRRGLMPIRVTKAGSLCLATSLTRDIEDYYGDGEEQTFLHEIPSELTGRAKYICLPISSSSSAYMTDDGKNLLNKVIDYLLSSNKSVSIPELSMTRFAVNGIAATPSETNPKLFKLEIDTTKYPDIDLTAVVPEIQLASPYTHTVPAMGDTVDLSIALYIPFTYEVTDYITREVYEISVRLYNPQGIEEVYTAGEWVNVYDIYGRKIATTNEDIYTMTLPRGMYIIVTESGHTLKIMK